MNNPIDNLILKFQPLLEHVLNHAMAYGIGAVIALVIIYFSRPYSTAILFYSIEIMVYLFAMHTVVHIIVRALAWFSNETTMKNVFDGNARARVVWTTPWIDFWDMEIYDPSWIVWLEVFFAIVIIGLVRYFRPMRVQTKFKGNMAPDKKQSQQKAKKGKRGDDDDDDGWGVATTRRFTVPDDLKDSKWK